MSSRKIGVAFASLSLITFLMVACGGGDDTSATAQPAAQTTAAGTTKSTSPTSASAAASASPSGNVSCRLTEKQVTEVLGVAMKDQGACIFSPADGKLFPNAGYNRQYDVAFSKDGLDQEGYKEQVPGVGEEAYYAYHADGSWMLVRQRDLIFEVHVDAANESQSRDLVKQLALRVLAGN